VGSNPTAAWMFVCCECCVLSGRGLCDRLITHPEESCRLWRIMCEQETSKTRRLKPATGLWKIQPQWVVTPRKQTNIQPGIWNLFGIQSHCVAWDLWYRIFLWNLWWLVLSYYANYCKWTFFVQLNIFLIFIDHFMTFSMTVWADSHKEADILFSDTWGHD
jgi:hypothetical protein